MMINKRKRGSVIRGGRTQLCAGREDAASGSILGKRQEQEHIMATFVRKDLMGMIGSHIAC